MLISKIGSMHIEKMCNNQDFYLMGDNFKLITDGCSAGKDNDFGTRLFCKLFNQLKEKNEVKKFESNVDKVFNQIFKFFVINLYSDMEKEDYEFLINNLSFTILACFETEDSFIVKFVGDGYIITQNMNGHLSYIKLDYGPCPPYFVYNYIDACHKPTYTDKLTFNTYVFDKTLFKNVGLASDGIEPAVFGKNARLKDAEREKFDKFILNISGMSSERNTNQIASLIQRNSIYFVDDTTILF